MKIKFSEDDYNIEEEVILKIKRQFWDIFTYKDDDDIEYYYRPLTKKEYYDSIVVCTNDDGSFNQIDFEDLIVGTAIVAPTSFNVDEAKAGIVTTLANEIIKKSGFEQSADELSEQIRAYKMEMLEPLNQMLCYIKEAFPELSMEDLDEMPLAKIIWYFSRADFILRVIKNQSIQILTPKEYMELNDLGIDLDELSKEYNDDEEDNIDKKDIVEKHKATVSETSIGSGSAADFPELREIDAFMRGELWND